MSTKERYGNAVLTALIELHVDDPTSYRPFRTIGEVATQAGVDRKTARKYLVLLSGMGYCEEVGSKHKFYRLVNGK